MSRVIFANPNRSPDGSRIALMTTFAIKVVPSLRTRQPSASYFPVRSAVASAVCGQPLLAIVLGIKAGEVLADEFRPKNIL